MQLERLASGLSQRSRATPARPHDQQLTQRALAASPNPLSNAERTLMLAALQLAWAFSRAEYPEGSKSERGRKHIRRLACAILSETRSGRIKSPRILARTALNHAQFSHYFGLDDGKEAAGRKKRQTAGGARPGRKSGRA